MNKLILLILILAISCASHVKMSNAFDPKEVEWILQKGKNEVSGQMFLRTVIGEIRSCAGTEISLTPVSKFSTERFLALYGNSENGFRATNSKKVKFNPEAPSEYFSTYMIRTVCDSQGNFKFENIPSGSYYLAGQVIWGIPQEYYTSYQGGNIFKKINLNNENVRNLILTN